MLYIAIALIVATGIAHSYLGERYLLMRLCRRDNLPKLLGSVAFTAGTLRFVWHILTVTWFGFAYLLFVALHGPINTSDVLRTVGVVSLLSAVFPLCFTRGRRLSWVVFLLIGVLLLFAAAGHDSRSL